MDKDFKMKNLFFTLFFILILYTPYINTQIIFQTNTFSLKSNTNPITYLQNSDEPTYVSSFDFDYDPANNLHLAYFEQQANHYRLIYKTADNDYQWNYNSGVKNQSSSQRLEFTFNKYSTSADITFVNSINVGSSWYRFSLALNLINEGGFWRINTPNYLGRI
ncbi:MAG: hypothetical protein JXA54_15970 [Candidatus Heimdallarchaeota archaeon]|nr:hypothetical protein [Candidatus Heimdallarchaeota archaeon]